MKKYKFSILGVISIVVFCFTVTYNINFNENPYGYLFILILFAFESIRSYVEGIGRGVEIIQEIRGK